MADVISSGGGDGGPISGARQGLLTSSFQHIRRMLDVAEEAALEGKTQSASDALTSVSAAVVQARHQLVGAGAGVKAGEREIVDTLWSSRSPWLTEFFRS